MLEPKALSPVEFARPHPSDDAVGDLLPVGFQHHHMSHARENLRLVP